jgi:imidazoleglycerol phosphate dehydratase HisB
VIRHIMEAIFKALAKALDQATTFARNESPENFLH